MKRKIEKLLKKLKRRKYLEEDDMEDLCFMLRELLKINEITKNELTEEEEKRVKTFLDEHTYIRDFSLIQ